jgi:diadenosine tetraphosphate (Ap4A) HIT family hydrolase
MTMADLHPQLQKDCLLVGRFPLCRLLLMHDANYPWFILVPDREGISEIFQLSEEDQIQLLRESSLLSAVLVERFHADKLNIAALGNVVPQLHIHHVVRYRDDPAWPAPVWGRVPARPYTPEGVSTVLATLRPGLLGNFEYF